MSYYSERSYGERGGYYEKPSYERNGPTRLYVGRLSSRTRTRDLEELFSKYGKVLDVDIKHDYAFIEFDDTRDADDARHYLNGREVDGNRIIVEFTRKESRGTPYASISSYRNSYSGRGPTPGTGRCFNCGKEGHWARDCKAGDWRDKCFNCGSYGHIERNCRNHSRHRYERRSYSRSPSRSSSRSYSRERSYSRSPESGYSKYRRRSYSYSRSPPRRYSRSPSRSPVDRYNQSYHGGSDRYGHKAQEDTRIKYRRSPTYSRSPSPDLHRRKRHREVTKSPSYSPKKHSRSPSYSPREASRSRSPSPNLRPRQSPSQDSEHVYRSSVPSRSLSEGRNGTNDGEDVERKRSQSPVSNNHGLNHMEKDEMPTVERKLYEKGDGKGDMVNEDYEGSLDGRERSLSSQSDEDEYKGEDE